MSPPLIRLELLLSWPLRLCRRTPDIVSLLLHSQELPLVVRSFERHERTQSEVDNFGTVKCGLEPRNRFAQRIWQRSLF